MYSRTYKQEFSYKTILVSSFSLSKNKQVWTWVFCQSEHLAMLQAATDVQIHYPDIKRFTKKQIK